MDKVSICKEFDVEFYDVDSMQIVWHGNYVKYLEKARCSLLDKIGYNYLDMAKSGYLFPVVDVKLRYVNSLRFHEKAKIIATLVEYENCIKIEYKIYNALTNVLCTKASTTQMCVKADTNETLLVLPKEFIEKVERAIVKEGKNE